MAPLLASACSISGDDGAAFGGNSDWWRFSFASARQDFQRKRASAASDWWRDSAAHNLDALQAFKSGVQGTGCVMASFFFLLFPFFFSPPSLALMMRATVVPIGNNIRAKGKRTMPRHGPLIVRFGRF